MPKIRWYDGLEAMWTPGESGALARLDARVASVLDRLAARQALAAGLMALLAAVFLVPGLIGFLLMLTAVLATALSVVREKERGTMEQLRVAPLRTWELILGKTLPYLAISFLAAVTILVAARLLFGVHPSIVDTPDALLVVSRESSQRVKRVVEELRRRRRKDLL